MIRMLLTLTTIALLAQSAWAQEGGVALGREIRDEMYGYAIRGPAEAEIRRETAVAELVRFLLRDDETGAVALTARLTQAQGPEDPNADLPERARQLAEQARAVSGVRLDGGSAHIIRAAGRQAIELRGPIGDPPRFYRRAVYVPHGEGYLVLDVTAPADRAERARAVSAAMLESLELFDVEQARQAISDALQRGRELLDTIQLDTLRRAAAGNDYYFAIMRDGEPIGYVRYRESIGQRQGETGLVVISETALAPGGAAQSLIRRETFCTADRVVEWWRTRSMLVRDEGSALSEQTGLKQHELLLVQEGLTDTGSTERKQLELPVEIYLPQALSTVLPRLLDLSAPAEQHGRFYAFAQYNPAAHGVDRREIRVMGPRELTLAGQAYDAILLTDRMAVDAPRTDVYLDAQSRMPLKLVSRGFDGSTTVIQATTVQFVRQRYADQQRMMQQLAH